MEESGSSKRVCREEEIDRLSNLPESIIDHILSFLPAQDVVRTSVLSTKWRHVWTWVTTLRLKCSEKRGVAEPLRFMNFVEYVLLHHQNPVLQNFSLYCSRECGMYRVATWLTAVLRRKKVTNFEVNFDKATLVFPSCLFDCESLAGLTLRMPCKLRIPTQVFFSRLKIIELCDVSLIANSSIRLNLPFLAVLKFKSCIWYDLRKLSVEAPVIQSFVIYDPTFRRLLNSNIKGNLAFENATEGCSISISGNRLKDLEFSFHTKEVLTHINLPPSSEVENATISARFPSLESPPLEQLRNTRLVSSSLLGQLLYLKTLMISGDIIQSLMEPTYARKLPMFHRLSTLKIYTAVPFQAVLKFLHSCPILESLTFISIIESWERGMYIQVPWCILMYLRFITFKSFRAEELDISVAKFLLWEASIAEEMHIVFSGVKKCTRVSISKSLRASPKSSSSLKLRFNATRR